MIKVGIHQPNFFPWLGYFHKMKESDVFIILDTVDIVLGSSKSITHRAKIKTLTGSTWLTIPLEKTESKKIQDLKIQSSNWKQSHLNLINQNYKKAPFFEEIYPFVEECILIEEENLAIFNVEIIKRIATKLGIQSSIIIASELKSANLDRNARIIDLIQKCDGSIYVSGKGGQNYHNEALFVQNGVQIKYLNYSPPIYPQLNGDFVEGLSVLDYLFNVNFSLDAI